MMALDGLHGEKGESKTADRVRMGSRIVRGGLKRKMCFAFRATRL
jgi:hypothetical protein